MLQDKNFGGRGILGLAMLAAAASVGGGKGATPTKGASANVQTVGDGKGKKEKKAKSGKAIYNYKLAVAADGKTSIVDDKGKLTELPGEVKGPDGTVLQEAYSPRTHKPLKKGDFGNSMVGMDFRVLVLNDVIAKKVALRDDLTKRAENLRKYGDEKKRKMATKLDKARKQVEELEKLMAEEDAAEAPAK